MSGGWIGVDLDGTLAHYKGWNNGEIGAPIEGMVQRVKQWLEQGHTVKIFTARVCGLYDPFYGKQIEAQMIVREIQLWCKEHIGVELEVTCVKDFGMLELWDDRAVHVPPNSGEPCCDAHKRR